MTDDSIDAEAVALVNEVRIENCLPPLRNLGLIDYTAHEVLCRAIKRHRAFKQEVSDAVGDTLSMLETHCDAEGFVFASSQLLRFIISKPKPDPLTQLVNELDWWEYTDKIRAALEARGLEIREKGK
jgi:hypothetical protein